MKPKVAVVVVNYNGRRHLEYCLPSLLDSDYEPLDLVVVDNASTDGSADYVQEHFGGVAVLAADRNLGWAGGNNLGVTWALDRGADYVVLQNNDTLVDRRWLREAVAALEAHPRLGVLGFRVLNEYRSDEDPDGARFDELRRGWSGPELASTDHVSGCALLVRAQVFRDVGLFDERFFVFGEEDDFIRRAMLAGYERARINVPVWHHHGGTWRRQPLRWSALAMRNDIRGILKGESPARAAARLGWLLSFVLRPRAAYDRGLSHYRRLRPSSWPVNAALLACAIAWNLVWLPQTLLARRRDDERARRAWPRVAGLPPTPLGPSR